MNVYLDSLGCRLNEAEQQSWARALLAAGCHVTNAPEDADVLILNSCAVTTEAVRKSRQFVRRIHRRNPSARLVVTGCYAELEPAEVAEITGVDLVVGNSEKDRLVDELLRELDLAGMPEMATEPGGPHVFPTARTRAFVKVQDGCRHRCTFCIVTVARGEERSRAIEEIVSEIGALSEVGYQEGVLTGVHLGGYGSALGGSLQTLVRHILKETAIPRLRLSSLEPWDLPPGFWRLWQEPRLMPHLHLPLQSGSDSVLRRMGRRCSTQEYCRLADDARAAIPDLTLTTDIITGFPGESESEWRETLTLAEEIGFAHIHVFTYSPRRGTASARYPGQIPPPVRRARSAELHALADRMKTAHLARFAGTTRPVLWEGEGEPLPDGRRRWRGLTDNYLRVETVVAPGCALQNRITPTRLARVAHDRLIGEIADSAPAAGDTCGIARDRDPARTAPRPAGR